MAAKTSAPAGAARPRTWFMLGTLGGVAILVRLLRFTGLVASDDLGYSFFAEQIATGSDRMVPHRSAIRYGLLLPLAALYRVFPSVDFGVHSLVAGLAAAAVSWARRERTVWLLLRATAPLPYISFGTTRFARDSVLPAIPRYIGLVYPPLFLLALAASSARIAGGNYAYCQAGRGSG